MPDMKEKLVELVHNARMNALWHNAQKPDEYITDMLMEDGVTVQEWISVKDRLPDTECLAVSVLTGPAYKEMLVGYVAEASNWDTGYECESDGEILPNVTHWMPLPQPPKGE